MSYEFNLLTLCAPTENGKFPATLTHDLRNPLAAAKLNAQVFLRYPDKAESRERIASKIIANLDRADQMIRDLLDVNLIHVGQKLPIQVSLCEIRATFGDVLEEMTLLHGDRFVLEANKQIEGYWSSSELRRVLENLISNAVKYGFSNTPITVTLTRSKDKVYIEVHNQGDSLSSEEQEIIFAPFGRTTEARISGKKGWGLGLTLVRGIIEAHGGNVSVRSEFGLGTTFMVELPVDSRP